METTSEADKTRLVYLSYVKCFCGAMVLAILGSLTATLLNELLPSHLLTPRAVHLFQMFSLVLEATSLGQSEWNVQPSHHLSRADKINNRLFFFLSRFGFFLIICSYQLKEFPIDG